MKLLCVVGARPQFIKLAPFIKAVKNNEHNFTILHTGQHYDHLLSDVFFNDLKMVRFKVSFER